MKITEVNNSYELDRPLSEYTLKEVSDYCRTQCRCDKCVFRFLCYDSIGGEHELVDPSYWSSDADNFEKDKKFQAILRYNYLEGK